MSPALFDQLTLPNQNPSEPNPRTHLPYLPSSRTSLPFVSSLPVLQPHPRRSRTEGDVSVLPQRGSDLHGSLEQEVGLHLRDLDRGGSEWAQVGAVEEGREIERFGPRLRLRQNDGSQPSDDQVLPFANRAERDSSLDLRTRRVLQREVPSTSRHPSRHIRSFQRLVVVVVVVSHRFQTSRSSASSNDLTSRRQLERLSQFAFLPSQKLLQPSVPTTLPFLRLLPTQYRLPAAQYFDGRSNGNRVRTDDAVAAGFRSTRCFLREGER
ncbi:hypothetical protein BDY24DRAFT_400665 [Mrakia frigida]|uniref:uncharacterized protein n=1 Tax=Mrakia frigida TaxID=29902 RepID=UPI003FCBFA56